MSSETPDARRAEKVPGAPAERRGDRPLLAGEAEFTDDHGTLLTESFQDYAVPRAGDVPEYETNHTVAPRPHNPLSVWGVGEAGTIAAPQSVVTALQPLGIDHINVPSRNETVRSAIEGANAGAEPAD